jgi:RNA polymerase sigma-70 factor (ECF subfamily)
MSSIKSYLCVIARNHAINVAKKRSLEGGISLDDDQSLLQIADDVMIDSELADEELRRVVIRAVEDLGEPDSSIIFRKYYYGESSKEIANATGLSVSNVDTRTHRALNKLRKMFGGNEV